MKCMFGVLAGYSELIDVVVFLGPGVNLLTGDLMSPSFSVVTWLHLFRGRTEGRRDAGTLPSPLI